MTEASSGCTDARSLSTSTPTSAGKRSKSPLSYRKLCDLCHTPNNVLVRCRIDDTLDWHFVCTKKCWKIVSGGEIDGPDKPYYVYGGMWKNKHAGISAKKPKRKKRVQARDWEGSGTKYVTNDRVSYGEKLWICRKHHHSSETTSPDVGHTFWKEYEASISDNIQRLEQQSTLR